MWVVTNFKGNIFHIIPISIHTTHVGGDGLTVGLNFHIYLISIHTTHVGGDVNPLWLETGEGISIHTTHVGGDYSLVAMST